MPALHAKEAMQREREGGGEIVCIHNFNKQLAKPSVGTNTSLLLTICKTHVCVHVSRGEMITPVMKISKAFPHQRVYQQFCKLYKRNAPLSVEFDSFTQPHEVRCWLVSLQST